MLPPDCVKKKHGQTRTWFHCILCNEVGQVLVEHAADCVSRYIDSKLKPIHNMLSQAKVDESRWTVPAGSCVFL